MRVATFVAVGASIILTAGIASPSAADPLEGIEIKPEVNAAYDRKAMYGSKWADADGDCQDARHEVLAAESLVPVTYKPQSNGKQCKVATGLWYGLFTGKVFTVPTKVQIDHLVPLKEAHQSGAHAWTNEKRRAFANDLDNPGHLLAVHGGTNQSKGCRDPGEWMPPDTEFSCPYVTAWLAVKRKWGLAVDQQEAAAIREILAGCESPVQRPNTGHNSKCLAPGAVDE